MYLRDYILKCIELAMPDGFMSAVERHAKGDDLVRNGKKVKNKSEKNQQ